MTTTTELNREIAALLGWADYFGDTYKREAWIEARKGEVMSNSAILYDGSAWADSADVALRELWPLLFDDPDIWIQSDGTDGRDGNPPIDWEVATLDSSFFTRIANGPTLAIAICEAYRRYVNRDD